MEKVESRVYRAAEISSFLSEQGHDSQHSFLYLDYLISPSLILSFAHTLVLLIVQHKEKKARHFIREAITVTHI